MDQKYSDLPMGIAPAAWNAMVDELARLRIENARLSRQVAAVEGLTLKYSRPHHNGPVLQSFAQEVLATMKEAANAE